MSEAENTLNATDNALTFALENGVDITQVTGSGVDGRVTKPDVEAFLGAQSAAPEDEQPEKASEGDVDAVNEEVPASGDETPADDQPEVPPTGSFSSTFPNPDAFDLVGEDGRRIHRMRSRLFCEEERTRITAASDETLTIEPASPFGTE